MASIFWISLLAGCIVGVQALESTEEYGQCDMCNPEMRLLVSNARKQLEVIEQKLKDCCNVCPEDFIHINGRCYRISKQRKSWYEAWSNCAKDRSSLLALETAEEEKALNEYFTKNTDKFEGPLRFYTNGNDIEKQGRWNWGIGSLSMAFTYTNFIKEEPNSHKGEKEDCMEYIANVGWNDVPCFLPFKWICEMPAVPASASKSVMVATKKQDDPTLEESMEEAGLGTIGKENKKEVLNPFINDKSNVATPTARIASDMFYLEQLENEELGRIQQDSLEEQPLPPNMATKQLQTAVPVTKQSLVQTGAGQHDRAPTTREQHPFDVAEMPNSFAKSNKQVPQGREGSMSVPRGHEGSMSVPQGGEGSMSLSLQPPPPMFSSNAQVAQSFADYMRQAQQQMAEHRRRTAMMDSNQASHVDPQQIPAQLQGANGQIKDQNIAMIGGIAGRQAQANNGQQMPNQNAVIFSGMAGRQEQRNNDQEGGGDGAPGEAQDQPQEVDDTELLGLFENIQPPKNMKTGATPGMKVPELKIEPTPATETIPSDEDAARAMEVDLLPSTFNPTHASGKNEAHKSKTETKHDARPSFGLGVAADLMKPLAMKQTSRPQKGAKSPDKNEAKSSMVRPLSNHVQQDLKKYKKQPNPPKQVSATVKVPAHEA